MYFWAIRRAWTFKSEGSAESVVLLSFGRMHRLYIPAFASSVISALVRLAIVSVGRAPVEREKRRRSTAKDSLFS